MLKALVTQSCLTLCDPVDCSPPGSSVHGDSSGKNTGVGCHAFLLPDPGIEPGSPTLQADSLISKPPGKPRYKITYQITPHFYKMKIKKGQLGTPPVVRWLRICLTMQGTRVWLPGLPRAPCRRKRQPTPVFLPEKSHEQRSLMVYGPWGRKESDTTE